MGQVEFVTEEMASASVDDPHAWHMGSTTALGGLPKEKRT